MQSVHPQQLSGAGLIATRHLGGGVYEEHYLISAYWRGGVCEEHILIGAQSSTFVSSFLS